MVLSEKLKLLSAFEFLRSLPTIRTDWSKKTPNQKWCYLYALGKILFNLIGNPLYEEDQTIHWYSYCSFAVVGTYGVLVMYTAYYYSMQGEMEKFLPSTCLFGIIFCYIPFVWATLSKDRNKYHSLLKFAGRFIYPDNHDHTEPNQICSDQMDMTMKRWIIVIIMLNFGASCGIGGTVYVYFTQGIRTTTIEVKIPFAEEDPKIEFAMNMLLQFVVYFHGFMLYGGMELVMLIFGNVINVSPRLIKNRLKELIESHERKEVSELQLRFAFKDLTKQLLDYENFVACLRDFLYWRTLVTPAMFTYSIAMAIFCQYTMGFVAGYGMAVMSWIQFYFICETGQDIEDNGLDDILYDSNWVGLPCELQKDLMQLISQRQNRVTLDVGPFGVVNRDLFAKVTNKVYSFVMFLHNFAS